MKFHSKALGVVLAAAACHLATANAGGGPGGYAAYNGYYQNENQYYQQQQPQQYYGQGMQQEPEQEDVSDSNEDVKPPLPRGWSEHFDPQSGQYYYYNSADGQTTWDRPEPEESQDEQERHAPDTPAVPEPEPVPEEESSPTEPDFSFQGSYEMYTEEKEEAKSEEIEPHHQVPVSSHRESPPSQPKPLGMPDTTPPQGMAAFEKSRPTYDGRPMHLAPQRPGTQGLDEPVLRPDRAEQAQVWGRPPQADKPLQQTPPSAVQHPPQAWGVQKSEEPQKQPWGVAQDNEEPPKVASPPQSQQQDPSMGQWGRADPSASRPPYGYRPEPQQNQAPQHQHPPPKEEAVRGFGLEEHPSEPVQQSQPGQQSPPPYQQTAQQQTAQRQTAQQQTAQQQPAQQQQQPPYPPYGQYGQYGQIPPRYGQPPMNGQYGQPPQGYGQYGAPPGYRAPPQQQAPQPTTGAVIAKGVEEGTSAVKEALGSTWQSLVGWGSKTRELTEQVRDQVVTSAAAAGKNISEQGTSIWGRAKSAVGSVFESNENQAEGQQPPYSLTGTHSSTQAQSSGQQGPPGYPPQLPPGYPPQRLDRRYGPVPNQQQQQPPLGQGAPPQQQQPPNPYGGRPPMQPWGDAPYPHTQQGQPQQRPPMQSQYGNYPPPQQRQGGQGMTYPPRPGGPPVQGGPPPGRNPYGPPQGGPPPASRGPPQQQQQRRQNGPAPDPWSHPGLSGDL